MVEMIRKINPTKKVIICIDGPNPLAKVTIQRKQKYRNQYKDNISLPQKDVFDHFQTKYKESVFHYLHVACQKAPLNRLEVIYFSNLCPGEGEANMMNYYRNFRQSKDFDPDLTYAIDSRDNDLFFLGLQMHQRNVYIVRMYQHLNLTWFSIDGFRRNLLNRFPDRPEPERIIDDIVALSFFSGNDFIPQFPDLCDDQEDSFQLFLGSYHDVPIEAGFLTEEGHLNPLFFKVFIYHLLRRFEPEFKEDQLEIFRCSQPNFSSELLKDMSEQILRALSWILLYYQVNLPNWSYIYPYSQSPPLCLLSNYIDTFDAEFTLDQPPSPFLKQFLTNSIYEYESLPLSLIQLKFSGHPLAEFFPFINDSEDVENLPIIDLEKILPIFNEELSKLPKTIAEENQFDTPLIFNHLSNKFETLQIPPALPIFPPLLS